MSIPRAHRAEVPLSVRAGIGGAQSDYTSAFELPVPDARAQTAEQWARATFEGAPAPLRRVLLLGWTLVLGLRLGPVPSPGHVLGWPVTDSGSGSATLTASSWLITAQNVVVTGESSVTWVTLVRFDRRIGRAVWSMARPVHHLVVPRLLRRASRHRPR